MRLIRLFPNLVFGFWIGYVVGTIPGTSFTHEYLGYVVGASLYGLAALAIKAEMRA